MATYDDLAARHQVRFQIYATAVAGERALASAAGVKPGSMRTWSRGEKFRQALYDDTWRELSTYYEDYLGSASEDFKKNGLARLAITMLDVSNISNQVLRAANREVFEGSPGLVDLMRTARTGSIGLLAQQRMAKPTFRAKDSAGRTWDADKLMNTIVRDFAYQTFIDAQFQEAVNDGATEVTIEHPDPNHALSGTTISMGDPAWQKLRNETFHINSSLTISHVSVSA